MLIIRFVLISLVFSLSYLPAFAVEGCGLQGVWVQVLGSGGPEINDQRASSGYLIWQNGKARILVDMGGGSLLRFEQSEARLNDLDRILLTHLHVDHSADLPYLIKASYFSGRDRDLPIYGPTGNRLMPSMTEFVRDLFGTKGTFRYLNDYLTGSEDYRLISHDVKATGKSRQTIINNQNLQIDAVPVHHGPIPALAWRVELAGYVVVFSGDMNNDYDTLTGLAIDADLLVAHHAIPEQAGRIARNLHMPPSVIGKIAGHARVKKLLLSHRMLRTIGHEEQTRQIIARSYHGPVMFAEDLQCMKIDH
jgi:ribonuclease BN (tRNA processing enzyme)